MLKLTCDICQIEFESEELFYRHLFFHSEKELREYAKSLKEKLSPENQWIQNHEARGLEAWVDSEGYHVRVR